MFFLRKLPSHDTLTRYARRFPGSMDPDVVHRALSMLRRSSLLLRELESHFSHYGLSQTQFLVLIVLDRQPDKVGMMPKDLAEALDVSRPLVTNVIAKLAERGLVKMAPHPEDQRSQLVSISHEAEQLLEHLLPPYWSKIQEFMLHRSQSLPRVVPQKTLIVGGSGRIGSALALGLQGQRAGSCVAMVRSKKRAVRLRDTGVQLVEADLSGDISHVFDGVDGVVFSAGSGPDTGAEATLLVDLWGARRVMDEAWKQQISRFVMVSTIGADDPLSGPATLRPYLVAKRCADDTLMQSSLAWTIVRPGRLTNEPATGLISTTRSEAWPSIPRADVAEVLRLCLQRPSTTGHVIDVYEGKTPISHALP